MTTLMSNLNRDHKIPNGQDERTVLVQRGYQGNTYDDVSSNPNKHITVGMRVVGAERGK
jgi:cytochrome oxidase assembly protein ShyY1